MKNKFKNKKKIILQEKHKHPIPLDAFISFRGLMLSNIED